MSYRERIIEELFNSALELSEAERVSFLEEKCGNDPEVKAEVESLLVAYKGSEGFLEDTDKGDLKEFAKSLGDPLPMEEKPGDRIDRYHLLERIGEGGWGVVWMAEQREPVRRKVALKILKIGMDTKEFVARFESERQALAMMDHPNIAHIFDGGATSLGRPYLVMELVRGVRITDYCDENRLTTEERLKLFIKVCQAVQHAHQKGVIHRDLKPSNVLVTLSDGEPVPKIIDFGVAKALNHPLTDKTVFTGFQAFLGTPVYTSPEQVEMSSDEIDTRSDIYSLGVLLYEILSGMTPFDPAKLSKEALARIREIICEDEPPLPSAQLHSLSKSERTTIAERRGSEAERLPRTLRGELDWITMKCLEKSRSRRYESASKLAEDLRAYLVGKPVSAAAPSRLYRIRKFITRKRPTYAIWLEGALVLVVIFATLTYFRSGPAISEISSEFAEGGLNSELRLESPDIPPVNSTTSTLAYDLYVKCINLERTEGDTEANMLLMRDMLEQAVQEDPNFVEAWARLNRVYQKMAKFLSYNGWYVERGQDPDIIRNEFLSRSRQALAKAVAVDPNNIQTLLSGAVDDIWPKTTGRMLEVKEIFDRIIETNPENAKAWYHLGWWYYHSTPRDSVNAFRSWEEALDRDPWNVRIIRAVLNRYWREEDKENIARLKERLDRVTPNASENRILDDTPAWIRLDQIEIEFVESADTSLIDEYERILNEGFGDKIPTMRRDHWEVYLRILTNDLDPIGALAARQTFHGDLDLDENGFVQRDGGITLHAWGYYNFRIQYAALSAYWKRNQREEAKAVAKKIIEVSRISGVSEHLVVNPWFVRTVTVAYAVLGEDAKARENANWLLEKRGSHFDRYELEGVRAMGWIDPDRAAELVMDEVSKNPEWPAMDWLAAFYNFNFQVIDHPKVEEYIVKQGKWVDYLATRSPVYAKY